MQADDRKGCVAINLNRETSSWKTPACTKITLIFDHQVSVIPTSHDISCLQGRNETHIPSTLVYKQDYQVSPQSIITSLGL